MKQNRRARLEIVIVTALVLAGSVRGADWPQWGGRDERNFVSQETGIPASFAPAVKGNREKGIQAAPAKNLKWVAKLGSKTYGNPTVSGGRVFIGTNDASLADPRVKKSGGGMVMCLDEATGARLWQLPIPAMKTKDRNFNYDTLNLGVCSSPAVDGDRVYVVGNRGDVLCLDVEGQANGNDGPFQDEGRYMVGPGTLPGKPGRFEEWPEPPKAVKVEPGDADIVWRFDMLAQPVDSWPQDAVDCSILVHGDYLYVCTSNGVDRSHRVRPSPNAPDIIVLDKKTG
ncbi:MAG TPA: PQQ-binding-like beta-propeller repeat protein, partial [Phycisphaerae bacterium]|nr:PQQ-binding-like beta-propeller repeat protein [Phycisphaerae bacterium]